MSIIFLILPITLLLSGSAVIAFAWATRGGQFDDLKTPAVRALHDAAPPASISARIRPILASNAADQAGRRGPRPKPQQVELPTCCAPARGAATDRRALVQPQQLLPLASSLGAVLRPSRPDQIMSALGCGAKVMASSNPTLRLCTPKGPVKCAASLPTNAPHAELSTSAREIRHASPAHRADSPHTRASVRATAHLARSRRGPVEAAADLKLNGITVLKGVNGIAVVFGHRKLCSWPRAD